MQFPLRILNLAKSAFQRLPRLSRPVRQEPRAPFPLPDFSAIRSFRPSRAQAMGLVRDLFQTRPDKSATRIIMAGAAFVTLFGVLIVRVFHFGLMAEEPTTLRRQVASETSGARPTVLDRNGELMAADVRMVSVFAEPRNIIDKDEAVELLNAVFPDIDAKELRDKIGTKKGFVWIKREITPSQQLQVHRLGLPGVGFIPEKKRVYPNGPIAAHVLGFANVDNVGISGIEKWIDAQGMNDLKGTGFAGKPMDMKPISLSIDMRVTYAMRLELLDGIR